MSRVSYLSDPLRRRSKLNGVRSSRRCGIFSTLVCTGKGRDKGTTVSVTQKRGSSQLEWTIACGGKPSHTLGRKN